jgi:hypothetical protein
LAGPSLQAQDFGSLLATILENEAQPMLGTYTIQDLAWLLDIEERCADLPQERIEACATMVTQARLSGKRRDDPELQLSIQRAFQGDRLELAKDVSVLKADLATTKKELRSKTGEVQELQAALIAEQTAKLRRGAFVTFVWKAILTALFSIGCITAGVWLALSSNSEDSTLRIIGLPALLLSAGVLVGPPALMKQVSQLRNSLRRARAQAEKST